MRKEIPFTVPWDGGAAATCDQFKWLEEMLRHGPRV
jgi:hypothetical protein